MALVTHFETPAQVRDFPEASPFYEQWHKVISELIDSIASSAVLTTDNPPPGTFYNASLTEVDVIGARASAWIGFPRELLTADHASDRREAFRHGDVRGGPAPGERTTQIEYLEWVTERDARGRLTRVTFTTETPEYWTALFRGPGGPDRVLQLYRELLGKPDILLSELTDGAGNYDPLNVWNTARGMIHYICTRPPEFENSLSGALKLVAASVTRAIISDNFQRGPAAPTAADPRVINDIRALARKGLQVTVTDPVGIYIGGWDDTGWTKPDGSPVDNYWHVVRPAGASGPPALRLVYDVPPSEGFVVGDIRIGGRPIEFGGQIAEHLTVLFPAMAGTLR
jgi:hypothetical protein